MAKLHMVIADPDESYTRGLSEYINLRHSANFAVSCFTRLDFFTGYMEQQPLIDILIISPGFYDVTLFPPQIKLKVMLSPGTLTREYHDFQIINRYGTGEKMLSEIVHLLSKSNPYDVRIPSCSQNTEIIGVYSPAGGTGKTTISAALSKQCAEVGIRPFYLNLETVQSTGVFFNSYNKRNFSYVFYYLKEKSRNLSFKMDGIKDTEDGVQYFSPPESTMEYDEISPDELDQLLGGIKEMGCYDYIFIDMSSNLDTKNYRILGLCDHVVLVTLQETIALHKCKMLLNELAKLDNAGKGNITDRFIAIVNRYKDGAGNIVNQIEGLPFSVWVPEYTRAFVSEGGGLVIDDDNFRKSIGRLIDKIGANEV
ncbi:MAG TPA: AAA family ATPase [Bacillota bacterium]|nr:AAA family ATPase [Bacillota bacterium]